MAINRIVTLIFVLMACVGLAGCTVPFPTDQQEDTPSPFGKVGTLDDGGTVLVFEVDVEGGPYGPASLEDCRAVLERRLSTGIPTEEMKLTVRGNEILVAIPEVEDLETVIRVSQRTALLEIIDTRGEFLHPGTIITTDLTSPGDMDNSPATGAVYSTIISGRDLKDVFLTTDALGSVAVGFELTEDGADRFYEFTSVNIGQPMAIVLDKVVVSSPQINDAISSNGQITGVSAQEARDLVIQLDAGTLPAPLRLVQSATLSHVHANGTRMYEGPSVTTSSVAELAERTMVYLEGPSTIGVDGQIWWPVVVLETGKSGYIQDTALERLDEIEQGYLDQIEENPNDVQAMAALASYLGNVGKTAEAIQWYERALTISPSDMVLRLDFARALAEAGENPDAEVQYLKVIQAEPNNGLALLSLARLYRSWSPPRTQDAVTFYTLAIERTGDSVVAQVAAEELKELTGTTPVASPQAYSGSPKLYP
jgi:hypothetical protein